MIRFGTLLMATVAILMALSFWLALFSDRPPLTSEPDTLMGDGSPIHYCELAVLEDSGKREIKDPKGNTLGYGYMHFTLPILA